MPAHALDHGLKIFSTCPPCASAQPRMYFRQVQEIARWSEDAGCEGILVYTDNAQVDPWLVSQAIIEATGRLCPLVAIQPAYMHPYSVAKMVTSFAFLYGRRLYLNMVAGGFKNDLAALNDLTPHDERYARLVEYTTIIQGLLRTAGPVSFEGRYYKVTNLKLTPPLAMKVSDSSWHRKLSELGNTGLEAENPYWLVPFQNYKATCPYLVGSYDRVADEVARYLDAGYRTFILDVPASEEELRHIGAVFERAVTRCPAG